MQVKIQEYLNDNASREKFDDNHFVKKVNSH